MFRQGQLAVHGLAILLGRIEAGIFKQGEIILHRAVYVLQGVAKRVLLRLRECCRQVEAEVASSSSNKIHQTWEALFLATPVLPSLLAVVSLLSLRCRGGRGRPKFRG